MQCASGLQLLWFCKLLKLKGYFYNKKWHVACDITCELRSE